MSDNTTPAALNSPNLNWNDQGLPVSEQFDDVYFSKESGIDESRYVFVQNNDLPEGWNHKAGTFSIFETGFGTGLNFLVTWQLWRRHIAAQKQSVSNHLHFISVEKFPLNKAELQKALALWPELSEFSGQLIEQYPLLIEGFHSIQFKDEQLTLTLIFDDVANALPMLNGKIDAWYLDGFAPAKNPDMWSDTLFRSMARLSYNNGANHSTVATFTAAGLVKRGLKGAGFKVEKVKGFGRKREMLIGNFQQTQGPVKEDYSAYKPWMRCQSFNASSYDSNPSGKVAIIGAGLAGATSAYALSRRGISCDIYDEKGIAQGASGNPQGAIYAKLAAGEARHTDIYVQGYLQSLRWVQDQLIAGEDWDNCGLIQIASSEKEKTRQQKFVASDRYPAELIRYLEEQQVAELSGINPQAPGLYFPAAGWVSPAAFCEKLIQQSEAELITAKITSIDKGDEYWLLSKADGSTQKYHQVIFACAYQATELLPESYLPVKSIRGQVSYLPADENAPELNTVLCGKGYISPAKDGQFCFGATYNLGEFDAHVRTLDHEKNLEHLAEFGGEFQNYSALWSDSEKLADLNGRVGFRCTTPDYLPMVGPVLNDAEFKEDFASLRRNATRYPQISAPMFEGLYLNIGHGSRGLSSGPLCAELLAAYMCGENFPMAMEHAEALHPGRFLIRNMIRNKDC